MSRQFSTAVSDFVLAVSCGFAVRQLTGHSTATGINFNYANAGFILIMAAASLGAVRFGMSSPPEVLIQCHKYTSQYLASVVGLCCLAAEFYEQAGLHTYGQFHLYASLIVLLVQLTASGESRTSSRIRLTADVVSVGAVVSTLFVCTVIRRRAYGCVASGLIVVLGLVVRLAEGGRILGVLPAVDLFHYGFVAVNYCLTHALVVDPAASAAAPRGK